MQGTASPAPELVEKVLVSLNLPHPLTPSPKGRGKEGGCSRTLPPLTCGALFGYISGVIGGEAPYMRRMP